MKRFLLLISIVTILTACSEGAGESTDDLTGTWKQTNSNDDASWMEATIEGDVISVDWVINNGDSRSIYWVGTYDAPGEEVSKHSWTSDNDVEATEFALLASTADTKEYTYEDGKLIFEVEMMGSTATIRMNREDE